MKAISVFLQKRSRRSIQTRNILGQQFDTEETVGEEKYQYSADAFEVYQRMMVKRRDTDVSILYRISVSLFIRSFPQSDNHSLHRRYGQVPEVQHLSHSVYWFQFW